MLLLGFFATVLERHSLSFGKTLVADLERHSPSFGKTLVADSLNRRQYVVFGNATEKATKRNKTDWHRLCETHVAVRGIPH
jgi:hypothetical protein